MRDYGQFCPIARSSELLAERWTPIIVRNLLNGCRTFNEIRQGAPGISTALLTQRLEALERHGVLACTANPSGRGATHELTMSPFADFIPAEPAVSSKPRTRAGHGAPDTIS